MFGQTDLISSRVKTNLLSLRASSDNRDSLLHGSGRSVSFGIYLNQLINTDSEMKAMIGKMMVDSNKYKINV